MPSTMEKVVAAAIRLFAEEGPMVPTARIAREAKVSNGSLFNYFATKQDLIDGVYLEIKREIEQTILPNQSNELPARQEFFDLWSGFIHWGLGNLLKQRVFFLLKSSQVLSDKLSEHTDSLFKVATSSIDKALENNAIRALPHDYIFALTNAQLVAAIEHAQRLSMKQVELEQHVHLSFEVYWNGISQ